MTDIHIHQPAVVGHQNAASLEQNELAAFEKGRMQGEMEAIRRLENEQQLKHFPVQNNSNAIVTNIQRPDVVEINRLTWVQRLMAGLGEAFAITYLICTIVWLQEYRGDLGWSNDFAGDNLGNVGMWNTHLLCSSLGLFFLTQAILMYRILPLNTNPWINRGIYCFFQCAAITCFILSLFASIRSTPEATFWGVESWCFALGLAVSILHGLYSMVWCLITSSPVSYENWAETNNHVTAPHHHESPEQSRDHSAANGAGRTIYTPQPHFINSKNTTLLPPTNQNVGASVPRAPANAPRWAENPNTHEEDYFLLPRAKWAVCGFVAMGVSILMDIASIEHIIAAGRQNWSQCPIAVDDNGVNNGTELNEVGREAGLIGALGLFMLASILAVSYAAMPPRTTLVKNGILSDQFDSNRRSSISHNAETRIGNIV